uniref:Ribosomal protein S3 n=1 Tax=Acanthothecis fontana TaxID=2569847 RepID=A0A4P8VWU0_9LECA|nr:ribosomal protein S3 [Acanthothecis fontana]
MLNIYKLKKKDNVSKIKNNPGDLSGKIKEGVPGNKEWFNSIYTFNKNSTKLLPVAENVVSNMIKSYFYMLSNKIENIKLRRINTTKKKKLSHKIWISRPEIKHTNSKLTITLYLYNRQFNYYLAKLLKIIKMMYPLYSAKRFNTNTTKKWEKLQEFLNYQLIKYIKYVKHIVNINNVKYKAENEYVLLINLIKNMLYKKIVYIKLKQIILFNKLKFNTLGIKEIIRKIYNKNVEINLISLKNFHLSSDILSQIITTKIRKRNNSALIVLKASLRQIKTPILNKRTIIREDTKLIELQNLLVNDLIKMKINKDNNNVCLTKNIELLDNKKLQQSVLNNIGYKFINGITLKASGRITRKIKAERAIYKIRSIGTQKNVNSSFKGLSTVMVRGYKKSNIDKTLTGSKTQLGAFGLKGWISSY